RQEPASPLAAAEPTAGSPKGLQAAPHTHTLKVSSSEETFLPLPRPHPASACSPSHGCDHLPPPAPHLFRLPRRDHPHLEPQHRGPGRPGPHLGARGVPGHPHQFARLLHLGLHTQPLEDQPALLALHGAGLPRQAAQLHRPGAAGQLPCPHPLPVPGLHRAAAGGPERHARLGPLLGPVFPGSGGGLLLAPGDALCAAGAGPRAARQRCPQPHDGEAVLQQQPLGIQALLPSALQPRGRTGQGVCHVAGRDPEPRLPEEVAEVHHQHAGQEQVGGLRSPGPCPLCPTLQQLPSRLIASCRVPIACGGFSRQALTFREQRLHWNPWLGKRTLKGSGGLERMEGAGRNVFCHHCPLGASLRARFLPILGHKDGSLSVIDWFLGRVQYTVEAHNPERVTALAEYSTQICVLSAGADLTVKMWRLFPYAEESLLPLLCFSCASPAWHLCFLGETLAVAFQDPETVTYSIVYYNLMEQTRLEHGPEDDAQDDITGDAPPPEGTRGGRRSCSTCTGWVSAPPTPCLSLCAQHPLPRTLLLPKPAALCLVQPGRVGEDLGPQEQAAPVRAGVGRGQGPGPWRAVCGWPPNPAAAKGGAVPKGPSPQRLVQCSAGLFSLPTPPQWPHSGGLIQPGSRQPIGGAAVQRPPLMGQVASTLPAIVTG
uniref:Uncharacterized protein n=1 Tax=Naja naja TaxID=35670 RepID=A0A8C6VAM1_NAJNA